MITRNNNRKYRSLCGKAGRAQSPRGTAASNERFRSSPYPELPSRNCQIMRQRRSDSPRSITWSGVEPSNCLFGRCNQSPITAPLMMSASASNKRVTSRIRWTLERCGGVPEFQYETVRGDAPVTRLTTSLESLYVRDNRRTSAASLGGTDDTVAASRDFTEPSRRDCFNTRPAALVAFDLETNRPETLLLVTVFLPVFMSSHNIRKLLKDCMQYCGLHAKYFFSSSSPKTRIVSALRTRSRNVTKFTPSATRTDGQSIALIPRLRAARPSA